MTIQDSVHYSLSITKNLGNFNSLKIECGYGKSISEQDDPDTVFEAVWQKVNDELEKRLTEAEELLAE